MLPFTEPRSTRVQRQEPHPDIALVHCDDRARSQSTCVFGQRCDQQRRLIDGPIMMLRPQKEDRWLPLMRARQQLPEVSISRHDDTSALDGRG